MLFRKGTGCVLGKRTLPEPPGRGRGGKGNGLQLQDTGKDEAVLELLKAEYGQIRARLEVLAEKGTISEYIKCTLVDMSNKVLENIARKYDSVRKGVKAVMGGKVLEYEAKTILEKGIEKGIEKGRAEERFMLGQIFRLIITRKKGFQPFLFDAASVIAYFKHGFSGKNRHF